MGGRDRALLNKPAQTATTMVGERAGLSAQTEDPGKAAVAGTSR